jgi:8-oxo-dGTP pyrophosphatase MutT (NUDIX family)
VQFALWSLWQELFNGSQSLKHGDNQPLCSAAFRPINGHFAIVTYARPPADFIDAPSFAARAKERLHGLTDQATVRSLSSDFDLNPSMVRSHAQAWRSAAVLIPVIARDELTVLLTQRTDTLASHAGQIAFPGGRIDAADGSALAAALREAHEEIGLDPALVDPLGFLDTYQTGTGFSIEPVVALVAPPFTLKLQESEVAEAFEVPLAFLMNPDNHQTPSKFWQGAERRFYAMPYENRYIWGATAGILRNMHERLFAL